MEPTAATPETAADPGAAPRAWSAERIETELRSSLPHWQHQDGWIVRKYRTGGWKGTLLLVNVVGHLAEAAWHHPDLIVSYDAVTVRLQTHDAAGVSARDLELAREVERVVQWQPGLAGGALEGTPNDDDRFRYIRYDAQAPAPRD